MKKHFIKGILALGLFTSSIQFNRANAQLIEKENLSFGAGVGYTAHSTGIGGTLAFNVRAHYLIDEKNAVVISYNTQLPPTLNYTATASARSSSTTPSTTSVDVEQKISFHNISLDYHRYFVGDLEESFGLYGLLGAGLTFATVSETYSTYDKSKYDLSEAASETLSGFMIDLGLGTNFSLNDQVAIFGEAKIAIPSGNDYNSRGNGSATNPIPCNYNVSVGVRFS